MTTQADIDALATTVSDLDKNLKAGLATVQTEVDNLQNQINAGTPTADLDLEPLRTAIAGVGADVEKVGQIKPTPAAPATGAKEAAPLNPDGTAAPNTTDPQKAAEQAQQSS